jgi:predicted nuclease of restriction endonuclease-like (RecB) superfamily
MVNFNQLVKEINNASVVLSQNAARTINVHLSLRNWMVGYYIVEFEQNGKDRAKYGTKLLNVLAAKLVKLKLKGLSETNLKLCRQFYIIYPTFFATLMQDNGHLISHQFHSKANKIKLPKISQTASDELKKNKKQISQTASDELKKNKKQISQTASDELNEAEIAHYLSQLFVTASYSHFLELIKLEDTMKRRFYELMIIKTTPSVKELERHIDSLTFERLGFSENKAYALTELLGKIQPTKSTDIIKSHYFFEFLNLPQSTYLLEESDLEEALINQLQHFILELGNGFCFEARQKRVLIGDEYFFIDLVFYHRILKCHVVVELKTDKANHEHIGQLKTYVNFYKKNIMSKEDNPPVGILLVTDKNKTLVEYAVADSDKKLFVSKYQVQLPKKYELAAVINNELKSH